MKLKKWYVPLLGLAMSLSACQGVTVKRTGIKDGTYAVKVAGYRGNIELEVLFEKQNLKEIKVVSHSETDVLTNEAFDRIPKKMIESQSLNVDLSTGATKTSKAIQEGVKKAILQAGGVEKESKVVVIGAGPAGMAATLRLRQQGIPTTLVEKAREVGGTMAFASNAYQYVSGTSLDPQSKKMSISELATKLQKAGKGNLEMIQDFQSRLQETINWQTEDLGMTFENKYVSDAKDANLTSAKYEKKKDELLALLRREIGVSRADVYTNAALVGYLKELSTESYEKNGLSSWIQKLDHHRGYLWLTKSGYDKLREEIIKTHALSEQYVKAMREKDSLLISSGNSVSEVAKKAGIALPKGIKLTGQLYCIELEPYRIQSLSGLKVDREFHVMSGNKAIPNVYAIGSAVGGVFGNKESLGVSNAFSFVSGKVLAEKLARDLEANK